MGCSTSSQTSAVDSTKPGVKPEESNGTSTTVTANGNVAEDSETIPDQTPPPAPPPADSSDAKSADDTTTATAPPPAQEEELQLIDADADTAPAEPPAEVGATPETASPENAQAEAEPKQETTEEAPASSD
ncbi:uncharacterized protein LOC144007360 [Festucalex cinctus]